MHRHKLHTAAYSGDVEHSSSVQPRPQSKPALTLRSLSLPFNGLRHRNLFIYGPRKDGRLSWRIWLNHSGQFTIKGSSVNEKSGADE